MKTIFKKIKENYKLILIVFVLGIVLGRVRMPSSGSPMEKSNTEEHVHEAAEPTIWTCSMHPQIKMDAPGSCPICGMDLIPLDNHTDHASESAGANEITLSEAAAQIASIQTQKISRGMPVKSIFLQGKVEPDERNIAEISARYGGRIEDLYVNYTGQQVQKGEKLASIYSPELLTAQRELLETYKLKDSRPSLYQAARNKLKYWDVSDAQIEALEKEGKPRVNFDILSPINGTVIQRHVALGDYLKEGDALFQVIDLRKVWVMFDAYESDLPWLQKGDSIQFDIPALPEKTFHAKINYIDPIINETSRVAKVRVELGNPGMKLKPGMFVNGQATSGKAENSDQIIIPKTSILWTGKRAIVYVKVPDRSSPTFQYREITLGPEAGSNYVVSEGLNVGEEIAVNGVFKIDAAAQLAGKQSMMTPPEQHQKMDMDNMQMNGEMNPKDKASENMTHTMFKVFGNCGICKSRIEEAALSVSGVSSAKWEEETKMLHLMYDSKQTTKTKIEKAVAQVGHDTEDIKSPDDVYNALPECCLYRN